VRAIADGRVRKTAALPQGGYAVVTEHGDDRISILSGLRQIDVDEGTEVKAGQALGLVGRDLDGAPVLVFELWQNGSPIDPRPLLPPPAEPSQIAKWKRPRPGPRAKGVAWRGTGAVRSER